MKKRLLSLICILALCLGLLPVSAFAEPVDNGTAAVNSPQAENVEPPEGTVVWITGAGYFNIPYQYTKMGSENVLLPVGIVIYFEDTNVKTFNAGTPYAENGEKTVSLTDQSNLAAIDCWTAAGTGSTYDPIVPLEFSSQLAKVSFVIDPGTYEDGSSIEVTALNTATGYQCGSAHPNSIEASTTAGDIHLAVTKLEDGTWQAEGLLVPGTAPDIAITYGEKTDTVSLASVFTSGFSAGMVYSARLVPDAANGQWTLSSPEEEARGTWSANFYDGNFIFLYLEELVPKTICGANVIMDEPDSFGITPETALTGKVTVGLDVEEVQMKDLLFSSSRGSEMVYQEGTENTFMYNGLNYYVLFKTSDTTEWSTDPISLIPGETKTVLLYIGEEYEIYYSIDITRPERPQIIGQPQDTAVTEGETATFTVEATGSDLSYQWQQNMNGSGWTDITDETNTTYTTGKTTMDMSGTQYRCVVKNSIDEVTSDAALLTVKHNLVKIEYKAPTCTVVGNEAYWTCGNCGKYFSDGNGNTEIIKDSWIISAINHDWNDAVYTWSDDGSTCTATRTCKNDSAHTETSKATVTGAQTKAPTCTEKGETTYTAAFEADWAVTQTKVLADISATGHSYGKPVWNWSEDGKTCTVTFTCEKDENHKESPKVDVTSAVKTPATCTETGVTTYTATVEFNGQIHTDTKDVADIPATGHSYGKLVWNWSEDGKTCKVTFTCEKDENHKETPEVTVTSAEKTPGTCTETGVTTYTATVEFNGQIHTDTKDVADIPATGHSYDNGKCTVCGAIASDFKVIIAAGANGSWQKGTKDGLTFTSNAAYKYFQKVQVDGKDLDASNYTVKEGSTIVTLKTSYLETLSVGKHTLAIVSETGTATTEFTIKAAAVTDDTQSPQTGDNSTMVLWIALLFVSGGALSMMFVINKRKIAKNR